MQVNRHDGHPGAARDALHAATEGVHLPTAGEFAFGEDDHDFASLGRRYRGIDRGEQGVAAVFRRHRDDSGGAQQPADHRHVDIAAVDQEAAGPRQAGGQDQSIGVAEVVADDQAAAVLGEALGADHAHAVGQLHQARDRPRRGLRAVVPGETKRAEQGDRAQRGQHQWRA